MISRFWTSPCHTFLPHRFQFNLVYVLLPLAAFNSRCWIFPLIVGLVVGLIVGILPGILLLLLRRYRTSKGEYVRTSIWKCFVAYRATKQCVSDAVSVSVSVRALIAATLTLSFLVCSGYPVQSQGANQGPTGNQATNQSGVPDVVYCPLQHGQFFNQTSHFWQEQLVQIYI